MASFEKQGMVEILGASSLVSNNQTDSTEYAEKFSRTFRDSEH